MFSSCSQIIKCSTKGRCVYIPDADFPEECSYRLKLERGQNLFCPSSSFEMNHEAEPACSALYLLLNQQLLRIYARVNNSRFSHSKELDSRTVKALCREFEQFDIPFELEVIEEFCIPQGDSSDPANARLVFFLCGKEYHILNFNGHLIQEYVSRYIQDILLSKGIRARIEICGTGGYAPPKALFSPSVATAKKAFVSEPSKRQLDGQLMFSL